MKVPFISFYLTENWKDSWCVKITAQQLSSSMLSRTSVVAKLETMTSSYRFRGILYPEFKMGVTQSHSIKLVERKARTLTPGLLKPWPWNPGLESLNPGNLVSWEPRTQAWNQGLYTLIHQILEPLIPWLPKSWPPGLLDYWTSWILKPGSLDLGMDSLIPRSLEILISGLLDSRNTETFE